MFTRAIFSILFLSLVSNVVFAEANPKFQHLNVEDGLPSRTIWTISIDKKNIVWLGTSNGLVKYDGSEIQTYRNSQDPTGTNDVNLVRSIHIDSNSEVLVGTLNGLAKVDLVSNTLRSVNITQSLEYFSVYFIHQSSDKHYWLGTNKGLVHLSENLRFISTTKLSSDQKEANSNRVNSILEFDDYLLLGTNSGLLKYDFKDENIVSQFESTRKNLLIQSLFRQRNGQVWAGTNEGLYKVNLSNSEIENTHGDLIKDFVYDIVETTNDLWVATRNQGLFRINISNSMINNYSYSKDDIFSVSDYDTYSLALDATGGIWVGTFNAGLNFLNLNSLRFERLFDGENSLSCLISPVVYSILEDNENRLWLGTQQGLARIDFNKQECILVDSSQNKTGGLLYSEIRSIVEHPSDKNFLIVNTRLGNQLINTDTFDIELLDKAYPMTHIYSSRLDTKGNYYLITSSGIYIKDKEHDAFSLIPFTNSEDSNTKTYSLEHTSTGVAFVGTEKGLYFINRKKSLEKVVWNDELGVDKSIRAMHIDSKNRIWLGVDNYALLVYTTSGSLIRSFEDLSLLPALEGFSSIQEDHLGSVWISSVNGLSKIEIEKGKIANFHSEDGLQGKSFVHGSKYKSNFNELYFGSRKGLTKFQPEKITENRVPPIVRLTKFLYFNEVLNYGKTKSGFSLTEPISNLNELILTHNDYVFGFEFSAQHYADTKRNVYAYMLENWDDDWIHTNAKYRRANYSNIPPGNYIFKVKASNSHGVWNETPRTIRIHIKPAPWASPTAYVVYFIAFVLAVFSFIKYRTRSLEKRATELENTVSKRTNELATEKEKVEQLLSRKNEEFANVSHEFRTPLTLIIGPIKQLLSWDPEDKYKQKLNIVQRNSLRLLRMVDQLLNLETFRVKAITQKSPQAISKTIQLISEAFSDLATEKNITFVINKIDPVCFDFTPDAIEKIILNILSNAIKYTKLDGNITVQATREGDSQYVIQVTDTGIGIAKDKLSKVFERFNRVMDENSEQVTGSGIGLALVKSLVESHDGSVELKSELGKGTTITVTLPIINEVDKSHINVYQNDEIIAMELMNVSSSNLPKDSLAEPTTQILSSEKPTILIIEDNNDMRQYIVESIAEKFNTIVAADGQAGLELAIQEVPDLIISDIMMPKLDGYQTTRALRETQITNHIPVVLLTARGDRDSRLKGWEEKADEYITKPFDVEELLIRISNLIEIRNILKRRFSETVFEFTDQNNQQQETESENLSIVEINTQRLQQEFIDQLNQKIEVVYMEADLSVSDIASSVNMGERQFYRKLRSIVDMTPNEYLRRFRLEKSKEILRAGKSASYTAFEVGFSSQNYFSKCFKAQYNMTPTQFVNQK